MSGANLKLLHEIREAVANPPGTVETSTRKSYRYTGNTEELIAASPVNIIDVYANDGSSGNLEVRNEHETGVGDSLTGTVAAPPLKMTGDTLKHDTVDTIISRIDSCVSGGRSLVVYAHDIQGDNATGVHISETDFRRVVDYAAQKGLASSRFSDFAARYRRF